MSGTEERRKSARQRQRARPSKHSSALESLRAVREGRESRTDQFEEDEDDGVYDEVTQEEYQDLVRKRQQADDFVVDDDGLGYADDGEEFIERVDEEASGGKGGGAATAAARKGVNGKIKADTLRRKARKLNQLGDEASQSGGIKRFLQTGSASAVGPASLGRGSSGAGPRGGGGGGLNLDDMLSDLTSNPLASLAPGRGGGGGGGISSASKRKRGLVTPQSARSSVSSSRRSSLASGGGLGRSSKRALVSSASWTVRDYEDMNAGGYGDGDGAMDIGDDFAGVADDGPFESGGDGSGSCSTLMEQQQEETQTKMEGDRKDGDESNDEQQMYMNKPTVDEKNRGKSNIELTNKSDGDEDSGKDGNSSAVVSTVVSPDEAMIDGSVAPMGEAAAAKPRSRFDRMKEANDITVTPGAEAALRLKPKPTMGEDTGNADKKLEGKVGGAAGGKEGMGSSYMPSLEFQGPEYALGEATSVPSAAVPSTSSWLQKDETGELMHMFWLDATEQNGTIYLIGKVAVPPACTGGDKSAAGATAASVGVRGTDHTFLSACVAVHGIEREVLVLPRVVENDIGNKDGDDDGESGETGGPKRADIASVYGEMGSVLVPSVIPRNALGEQFRCKAVMRKYAFGDLSVPREETQYLKIKYPAKYPALSENVCDAGGKTFQAIYGARTPLIESFLLKRKLMGPSWVTVRNPKVNNGPVSWCKIEVAAQNPKSITRLTGEKMPPTPPVVTMSLSMKTVVSPRTHTHEVVALSALVHREVKVDSASDEDGRKMSAWLGIRPLGQSAGDEFPKVFPHDLKNEVKATEAASRRSGRGSGIPVQTMPNERALLSLFFQKMQQEDPDVLVAHNLMGFDFDILLSRAVALKLATWSKIGRLRRNKTPRAYSSSSGMKGSGGSFNANIAAGRLLCDTYLSAKEFLRETTYSLTHLAGSQLKAVRSAVDPADVPRFFGSARDIVGLALHTANDACLVQRLMFKLQVVPLSCQLTALSGNLWARTMRGGRAERIEYLLLHEFHKLKYLTPEKVTYGSNKEGGGGGKKNNTSSKGGSAGRGDGAVGVGIGPDGEDDGDDSKVTPATNANNAGGGARRKKAAYAGGLVLEPKKGLYDEYILLLDFNSLYPSLIQEYNLCFTTMNWAATDMSAQGHDEEEEDDELRTGPKLPALPEEGLEMGVLPRVIRTLVERRAVVKKMLKKERDPSKKQELDIRQKALKLTANSMYGCLGFSFSRFYAKPIAALVTAQGRESLQRTVDLAETQLGLEVIYGDTDSVMINTHSTDLKQVKEIGNQVKREVNKLYKSLELDLDGVFKSMLLLKKKKYAALVVVENANGSITYEKEMKGLDLVRREWCVLSKDTGKFVLDRILSGEAREAVVTSIHEHLEGLAVSMRRGEVAVPQYVITKGLNKAPHEYPDAKSQPHVQVALAMLKAGKSVNVGHHIPYVMCKIAGAASPAERARHPDDVLRTDGKLEVDVEWYLSQQIVPPVSRLCEPIEGTSMAVLAEKMGLDASKFKSHTPGDGGDDQDDWGFTPTSRLPDKERFRDVELLKMTCRACRQEAEFRGVFSWDRTKPVNGPGDVQPGLMCPNAACGAFYWGAGSEAGCISTLYQRLTLNVRKHLRVYYQTQLQCDDSSCGLRTRSAGVMGVACPGRGCQGRLVREYSDKALYDQLKFYETLFDVDRAQTRVSEQFNLKPTDLPVSAEHRQILGLVGRRIQDDVQSSGYNWIRPTLWSSVFISRTAHK